MSEPRIADLLHAATRPLLSFEFFPPRDDSGMAALAQTMQELKPARPDFVTVTYGAGGSTQARTLAVCAMLRDGGFGPVMPHLTCVGASRADLAALADDIYARGFRNIMALRGDPPRGATSFQPAANGLAHAGDLVALLKQRHPDFCCGVAAYPEMHPEAASPEQDVLHLKAKLDAGADFATTQLFFDNARYHDFTARCRRAGVTQPIIPGLLPAISLGQLDRTIALCKAGYPAALAARLKQAGDQGPAAEEVGILWAVRQAEDLLAQGAPGIHLYIFNRARTALAPTLAGCMQRWRNPPRPLA